MTVTDNKSVKTDVSMSIEELNISIILKDTKPSASFYALLLEGKLKKYILKKNKKGCT